MPSITYWSRLEPRPRAPSVSQSLSARIRDPLWMLTRQWQFGEFQGEDAGSPAHVELSTRISPITAWRVNGDRTEPLPAAVPLEALVEAEPFSADHAVRVELGQTFERFLAQAFGEVAVPQEIVRTLRAVYPILTAPEESLLALLFNVDSALEADLNAAGKIPETVRSALGNKGLAVSDHAVVSVNVQGSQWSITDHDTGNLYAVRRANDQLDVYAATVPDQETARFLAVCAGRAIDGVALYDAARAVLPLLPAPIVVDDAHQERLISALQSFTAWVREVFGVLGSEDPSAWDAERLEYRVEVVASIAAGGEAVLSAHPDQDGSFEWYSFDFKSSHAGDLSELSRPERRSIVPIHVRFRGMPNARWWDFETNVMDFGNIRPDRRDLAKLVVVDFMLVHGNDWFVLPFNQPVGSLCHTESLVVHDVFGGLTIVERADVEAVASGEPWTMFTATVEDEPGQRGHFLLIPPSAAAATQSGPTVEEVRFIRDEIANLVWAIEHTTEDGIGQPWDGYERDLAASREPAVTRGPDGTSDQSRRASLLYQLQTTVPTNWIPFLPVAIDGVTTLERGVMLRPVRGTRHQTIHPLARLLTPAAPYRIREEEIPRSGVRVLRMVRRSRWTDGSTHLWIARPRFVGAGEGSSGLRFDLALPAD